jgi:multidrug resistance efflux pump
MQSFEQQVSSDLTQLKIDQSRLAQKQQSLEQAKASMNIDKINLDETTVRAGSDGVVDNMFLSVGTPVSQHQALFSFVNTSTWFVQANMNETDLRKVRPGDKALIWLRMYGLDRVFHGVIVNNLWVTDRQSTTNRSQQQTISTNNEWLNLPQRVPLLIEISDPDPQFPLNPGVSAYVYIQTK